MRTYGTSLGEVRCVYLLCELFLAQLVEDVELPRKVYVLNEADTGKLHSDDDVAIGNHHGDRTEVDLEVLRQLLTPRVPRVLQVTGRG